MTNSRLSMIGIASIAYLLAGPALGQPSQEARAGSCTKTTRGSYLASNWSVRTIFLAETKDDKVFDVTVYRNGTQKNQKFISAGDPKMQTTMNVAKSTNDIDVVAEIIRRDNPGAHKISCTYTAKAKSWSDGDHTWMDTTWLPGEPVCENIKEICHDCKISCNKSYDPDQYRWETVFTISD